MHIFHNRPLALACIVFALTSVAFADEGSMGKLLAAGVILLLLLILLIFRIKKKFLIFLCLSFALISLLSSLLFFEISYQRAQALVGKTVQTEGVVLERTLSTPYLSSFRVHVTTVDGEEASFDAVLETSYASALQVGDRFSATVTPRAFDTKESYEEEFYRLSQGELVIMVSEDRDTCGRIGEDLGDLRVELSGLKTRLSYRLYTTMGGEEGAVCAALLLGDRSFLSGETSLQFQRSGTSHLLALSGLHVSILIGFVEFFLRKLYVPKLIRGILIPLLALGYLALTGFALSTVRAVLMACVMYLAFLWRARYDSLTAICVALVLILFVTPYAVWDISLWLSFIAAASIVIFFPAFQGFLEARKQNCRLPERLFSVLRSFLSALFVGVIANLGLFLLMAIVFEEISVLSVPVTMLLSFPITVLLPLSALTLLITQVAPLSRLFADLLLYVVRTGSNLYHVLLPMRDLLALHFIAAMTLVLVLFAVTKMKAKYATLLVSLFLVLGIATAYAKPLLANKGVSMICMSTYGGELLFFSERGKSVVLDLANGIEGNAGIIQNAAEKSGCTEIDDLVLTRYYNRSPNLIAELSELILVRCLRLPPPQNELEESIAMRLEEEAELHGIRVCYHTNALAIEKISVLCFEHTPMEKDNASHVLISMRVGEKILTCFNAAVLEGGLGDIARNYIGSSNLLLVSSRAKGSAAIPVPGVIEQVILGENALAERFWRLPDHTDVIVLSATCQIFLK